MNTPKGFRRPSGTVLNHKETQAAIRYMLTSLDVLSSRSSHNWQAVIKFVADKTEPKLVTGKCLRGLIV